MEVSEFKPGNFLLEPRVTKWTAFFLIVSTVCFPMPPRMADGKFLVLDPSFQPSTVSQVLSEIAGSFQNPMIRWNPDRAKIIPLDRARIFQIRIPLRRANQIGWTTCSQEVLCRSPVQGLNPRSRGIPGPYARTSYGKPSCILRDPTD